MSIARHLKTAKGTESAIDGYQALVLNQVAKQVQWKLTHAAPPFSIAARKYKCEHCNQRTKAKIVTEDVVIVGPPGERLFGILVKTSATMPRPSYPESPRNGHHRSLPPIPASPYSLQPSD